MFLIVMQNYSLFHRQKCFQIHRRCAGTGREAGPYAESQSFSYRDTAIMNGFQVNLVRNLYHPEFLNRRAINVVHFARTSARAPAVVRQICRKHDVVVGHTKQDCYIL